MIINVEPATLNILYPSHSYASSPLNLVSKIYGRKMKLGNFPISSSPDRPLDLCHRQKSKSCACNLFHLECISVIWGSRSRFELYLPVFGSLAGTCEVLGLGVLGNAMTNTGLHYTELSIHSDEEVGSCEIYSANLISWRKSTFHTHTNS